MLRKIRALTPILLTAESERDLGPKAISVALQLHAAIRVGIKCTRPTDQQAVASAPMRHKSGARSLMQDVRRHARRGRNVAGFSGCRLRCPSKTRCVLQGIEGVRERDHFELSPFFEHIYGSELDGALSDKADLIAHALHDAGLDSATTIMIGDRHNAFVVHCTTMYARQEFCGAMVHERS
jgi:hypothetical protein